GDPRRDAESGGADAGTEIDHVTADPAGYGGGEVDSIEPRPVAALRRLLHHDFAAEKIVERGRTYLVIREDCRRQAVIGSLLHHGASGGKPISCPIPASRNRRLAWPSRSRPTRTRRGSTPRDPSRTLMLPSSTRCGTPASPSTASM